MATSAIVNAQGTAADSESRNSERDDLITSDVELNDGSQAMCEDWGEDDPIGDNEILQNAAKDLLKHCAALDKYARRTEVIEARRQRFYRRGDQYVCWSPNLFNFVPYPDSGGGSNGSPGQDAPRYTDVYDIYWPYMRALISIGVQNPPGVDFEPDDPTKAADISAARAAETFRYFVDRVNQRKALQSRIMSLFCTDGRVILYTRNVRNAQKFGTDENGEPVCVQQISADGVLEWKVPIVSEDEMDQWPYAIKSDEIDINIAKQTYPQYAENIKQGSSSVGESAYERMARIGVLQGTRTLQQAGDAYAHLSTRHRAWFRPAAFRHCPDEIRDQFKKLFPDGMKLIVCGDAYCGSVNQSMDDHLTVKWPGPGDGASKPSMLKNLVPVQDAFNDYKNLEKEIFDFTIPATYQDSALGDIEALREQASEPGNHIEVVRPDGIQALADAFYTEPPPVSPPSLVAAYQDLRGALGQFLSGAQPALFGGSDEHNETKGGIAMLRDQAMGQFSICWGAVQELFAGAYKQAVVCRAAVMQQDDEKLNVRVPGQRGRSQVATIAITDLKKGNFHAYPDLDSSFPETTGSKRQTIMSLVTQAMVNPEAVSAFGILEPGNLEIQRQLLGIHDWTIPAAAAYDKQMGEIELLLKQRPVPDVDAIKMHAADAAIEGAIRQKAEPMGVPLPEAKPDPLQLYKPSIPIDPKWDFNQFEAQAIKDFLSSQDGIDEAKTNPWGILNVKLHGQDHLEAAAAQAGPPPGMIPPKPGGPGKPQLPPPPPAAMNAPVPGAVQ